MSDYTTIKRGNATINFVKSCLADDFAQGEIEVKSHHLSEVVDMGDYTVRIEQKREPKDGFAAVEEANKS